jgi:glucose/arabinose dehydrogenase
VACSSSRKLPTEDDGALGTASDDDDGSGGDERSGSEDSDDLDVDDDSDATDDDASDGTGSDDTHSGDDASDGDDGSSTDGDDGSTDGDDGSTDGDDGSSTDGDDTASADGDDGSSTDGDDTASADDDGSESDDEGTGDDTGTDGEWQPPTRPNPNTDPFELSFQGFLLEDGIDIMDMELFEGGEEFLVVTKQGWLQRYRFAPDDYQLLDAFQLEDDDGDPLIDDTDDCGAIGIAISPDYASTGHVFVSGCNSIKTSSIYRYEYALDDVDAIQASRAEVLRVGRDNADSGIHNVGDIDFDADGNLWALFGEKNARSNAQNTSNLLGSLVRIVPDPTSGGSTVDYEPSPGNPFLMSGGSAEIYAYGLRSPWKGMHDSLGRFWIGDVGANTVEEINLVTEPGQNFGWPDSEGPCSNCGSINPTLFWIHDDERGYLGESPKSWRDGAAYVALEYQPNENDPYEGRLDYRVIFGDYVGGFVRVAEVSEDGEVLFDHHVGYLANATAWMQGPDGYVYGVRRRKLGGYEEDMTVLFRAVVAEE